MKPGTKPCRRCSECPGQEHHFLPLEEQDESNPEEFYYPCKHCDARLSVEEEEAIAAAQDGAS